MAEKKLWTVTIEQEIVVVAENEADAEEAARDALGRHDVEPEVSHARQMSHLPCDWDLKAIPFGEGNDAEPDRNIEGWIKLGAAPEYEKQTAFLAKKRAEADARKKEP
jgi:hypothetical protein